MKHYLSAMLAGTALCAFAAASPAFAQGSAATETDSDSIVVTGTLIRGVAPAGTETITVTQQDILEAGGITVQDVLAKIPQLSFFNRQPTSGNDMGVGQRQPPQQPQIHGLPTLVLLDGRRIASAGAGGGGAATSIDPSIIPTGVLGGIEIVADGGSATYGSDAVGGVINMTTLKRYDGIKADGSVTLADDYKAYRIAVTGGAAWDTGSVYASYSYNSANELFGADRPYIEQNPRIVTCSPATVTANAGGGATAVQYTYTGVGADGKPLAYVAGPSSCSRYAAETILPAQEMHSVFGGLNQEIAPWLTFDMRGYYSTRRTKSFNAFALVTNTTNFPATNPFYVATPAQVGTTRTQRVDFSLAPAVGPNLPTTTNLDTWGLSGEFDASLFGDFHARLLGNYSESKLASLAYEGANTALLTAALARTDAAALNPYAPASTPGSTLAAQQIANRPTTAQGIVKLTQVRLITDGTLAQIGGNDVKIALGGEMQRESFGAFSRTVDFVGSLTSPEQRYTGSRTVWSAFGELEIPVIAGGNGPIDELRISLAGRYDHYSDFGSTFNPRLAVSLKPVEWLTVRGTYGKSFIAPSLPQLFSPLSVTQSNTAFILPPGANNILIVTGGNPTLQPQKAKTWTLGADLKAEVLDGLRLGITYYNARFRDKLAAGPFTSVATFYTPTYASFYIQNPTLQQVQAFIGGTHSFSGLSGFPTLASLFAADGSRIAASPAYISSGRTGNLSKENTDGLDVQFDLTKNTAFGSLEFGLGGNYVFNRNVAADGLTFLDVLPQEPRFRGAASLGANVGNFRATATVLRTSGFALLPNVQGQTTVKGLTTVDMFMSYSFKDETFLKDAVLSLQVGNLFGVRPPVNLTAPTGYDRGSILGRTFQFGLSKKF